jgi:hypothetical protein
MADYHADPVDDYHDETDSQDMSLSPDMMESMKRVEQVMGEELDKLRSRKAKLREGQRALNKIRERIELVSCSSPQRLKLNVGGKKIELKMTHVERNNFFRPLMSNAFTQPDAEGFYFIDHDPTFVMVIVNFLRGGLAAVDLELYTPAQLRRIHREAEFYMVQALQDKVDELLRVRGPSRSITCVPVNAQAPVSRFFNGLFFQLTPLRNLSLHSIAFVCGEKRPNFVACVMLRECDVASLTASTQMRAVGEIDQAVEKGMKVTISMTALSLLAGRHYVIGVYSSINSAVGGVPAAMGERRFGDLFTIDATFHTNESRHPLARKVDNEYDFAGEIYVSAA